MQSQREKSEVKQASLSFILLRVPFNQQRGGRESRAFTKSWGRCDGHTEALEFTKNKKIKIKKTQ